MVSAAVHVIAEAGPAASVPCPFRLRILGELGACCHPERAKPGARHRRAHEGSSVRNP
jgi:hypothetical protein